MGYFDERAVTEVDVYGIQYFSGDDPGVGAHVSFTVAGPDGGENGPSVQMQLFVQASKDDTLASIHEKLVDRAYELVCRFAAESGDSLKRVLDKPQAFDLRKP